MDIRAAASPLTRASFGCGPCRAVRVWSVYSIASSAIFGRHGPALLKNSPSYQIIPNSLAFNEASYVPSNVVRLIRHCQDSAERHQRLRNTSPYTWLAAQDKGVNSFPNHSLLVSMMDTMLARVSLRRTPFYRIQGPSMPQCQTVPNIASSNIYLTAPTPE